MPGIIDTTKNPIIVPAGTKATPFSGVSVLDPIGSTESVAVSLISPPGVPISSLGTLTDPTGGGVFDPSFPVFTETGLVTGDPSFATSLLGRLNYTAPTLAPGVGAEISAFVVVSDTDATGKTVITAKDAMAVVIAVVPPPAVTGDVLNQPDAGSPIRPFATTVITDETLNFSGKDTATITLSDGGSPTDADGLLTGPGLSKTGVGTYALANADAPFTIQSELHDLLFTPTPVGAGATRTTTFDVKVTDAQTGLSGSSTDSVMVIGPAAGPPTIANTLAGQTVAPSNGINPFASVTVSDSNSAPSDSATITLLDSNGAATDATGSLSAAGTTTLTKSAAGTYALTATDPQTLTKELNGLTFHPAPLQGGIASVTTTFSLAVTDANDTPTTATDSKTTVIEQPSASPPPETANFIISDQTTGKTTGSAGEPFTGPVSGIDREIILLTSDNINVNSTIPNVFIHSGSGDDALNVSAKGGTNVLDGFTGSNFLTGGSGTDQFFVDDRANIQTPPGIAGIWSTVVGFHPGDSATIWGLTAADFKITTADAMGAVGSTGLTWDFAGSGTDAKLTLAGFSSADMSKLNVSFGTTTATGDLPAANFMLIHEA